MLDLSWAWIVSRLSSTWESDYRLLVFLTELIDLYRIPEASAVVLL